MVLGCSDGLERSSTDTKAVASTNINELRQ